MLPPPGRSISRPGIPTAGAEWTLMFRTRRRRQASWQIVQSPLQPRSQSSIPRDIEIYILEAEAWFRFNQVYEHTRMINHLGSQLEGTAREWWTSKLRFDRAREGRLFNDWQFFTKRLAEQFNPRNARMEAYNKLLALRLTSDAPGAATRHVEQFRDLEGQVNLGDNELTIDLFRGSLTRSIQEKFERNPPKELWEWFREVEEIDRQRMLVQSPFGDRLRNLIQLDHRLHLIFRLNLIDRHNLIRRDTPPNPFPTQTTVLLPINPLQLQKEPPAPSGGSNNTCHLCNGIGHWARNCPSRRVDSLGSRPMGPKVMVVTKDPLDEASDSGDGRSGNTKPEQEDMDLRPYQQHMDSDFDHEEEQDDDDDEGNFQILSLVTIGNHNLGVVEASVANTADYDLILGFTELRKLKPTIRWDTGQLEFKTQEQDRPRRDP
ncbi:hypothetical protein NDA14_004682 [Ustilago hordei]|nr:hypothetical protein NDA14_004682 [Ustilago hordei]